MRSYLSLIPISARVRKKQNRMTLFCIITAVLLVTAVFSMADMGVRMETRHSVESHGNWHIRLTGISDDTAEDIAARRDVAAVSRYAVTNIDMTYDYSIGGIKTEQCFDECFSKDKSVRSNARRWYGIWSDDQNDRSRDFGLCRSRLYSGLRCGLAIEQVSLRISHNLSFRV